MASLTAAFRASLPARLSELRHLAKVGPEALPALRACAHKLAGQGGVFDVPEISQRAADLEEALPEEVASALARLAVAIEERG